MSEVFVPVSDKTQALLSIGAANEVIAGACLPFPIHDPCPDMTALLHKLWFAASPFLGLDHGQHRAFLVDFGPPRSVGEILTPLTETLVSLASYFFLYTFLIVLTLFSAATTN
jgi:hypothetical protein